MKLAEPIRARLRRLAAIVVSSEAYLQASLCLDCLYTRLLLLRGTKHRPEFHLVLATHGRGNNGDQALLEAFLDFAHERVVVIVANESDFKISGYPGSVTMRAIPNLVGGFPLGRLRARRDFFALLYSAKSFSVIGADIMDGSYDRRESVIRSHLLRVATEIVDDVRLISFSWDAKSDNVSVRALLKASRSAKLYVRDPISLRRLESLGFDELIPSADIVFSSETETRNETLESWIAGESLKGRGIVVLNTSGLIDSRKDLVSDYYNVCTHLISESFSVVVMPHVVREGDSDLVPLARLAEKLPQAESILFMGELLTPREVRSAMKHVSLVITGRLHLGIIALSRGVPVIVFSTNGKVEGTLSLLGQQDLALEPIVGSSVKVNQIIDLLPDTHASRVQQISARLQEVRTSALAAVLF